MLIQIGGQYGDPEASDYFFPLQKRFNDLFKKHFLGEYFHTLNKFSIVFRVSANVRDFGSAGPERLKHLKRDTELTIDLIFTENQWRDQHMDFIQSTVKDGVNQCIKLLLKKAEKLGDITDEELFQIDLEKVLSEYEKQ